jgi:hypothetical protein
VTASPTPEERGAFREFVRTHHPDRGGDPEVFAAGLARFRTAHEHPGPDDERRDDAPVEVAPAEVVGPLPFPVRVGVALIRTWKRRSGGRAE